MIVRSQNRRVRGQSAVMVAFLTMIVVMLIAFTTNLGKLVTEKIAMQNAVDMAVYSGAATQAGYLNKMRKVNDDIWKIHDETRQRLEPSRTPGNPFFMGPPCPPCTPIFPGPIQAPAANSYMQIQARRVDMKLFEFDNLNRQAPGKAFDAAKEAADSNYQGTGSKLREKARSPGIGLMPVKTDTVDWNYMGWALSPCPPGPPIICRAAMVTEIQVKTWKFRDTSRRGEVMFAAGIENATPNSNFLDGTYLGQFFGGNCRYGGGSGRCALSTYAAAHPHQGKLGSIPFQGGTPAERMWIPGTNNPVPVAPAGVERQQALQAHKVFDGQYYDYKVRFIGIFDQDAQTLMGQPLRTAVSPQYGNRMEH